MARMVSGILHHKWCQKFIRKGLNPLSTNAPFQGFNPCLPLVAEGPFSRGGDRSAFPAI